MSEKKDIAYLEYGGKFLIIEKSGKSLVLHSQEEFDEYLKNRKGKIT